LQNAKKSWIKNLLQSPAFAFSPALISIIAGLIAGLVSLIGFGIDSAIEIIPGTALIWRLSHDLNPVRHESAERTTLRIAEFCFVALATYILYDSELFPLLLGRIWHLFDNRITGSYNSLSALYFSSEEAPLGPGGCPFGRDLRLVGPPSIEVLFAPESIALIRAGTGQMITRYLL
jgi:hypothetical protein